LTHSHLKGENLSYKLEPLWISWFNLISISYLWSRNVIKWNLSIKETSTVPRFPFLLLRMRVWEFDFQYCTLEITFNSDLNDTQNYVLLSRYTPLIFHRDEIISCLRDWFPILIWRKFMLNTGVSEVYNCPDKDQLKLLLIKLSFNHPAEIVKYSFQMVYNSLHTSWTLLSII
jgi:hypothetical protein